MLFTGDTLLIMCQNVILSLRDTTFYSAKPHSLRPKQIIANERKELEKMLRAFNIYVDNPVCVLTQEESKKFIQGQEREKYDFYLKVTETHCRHDENFIFIY